MAVDERAIAIPRTTAVTGVSPSSQVPQATARPVTTTCVVPVVSRSFFSRAMRW